MATPAASTTQNGGPDPGASAPAVIKVRVITPIVFWASLAPWASATVEAEATCPSRKRRRTVRGSAPAVTR